MCQDTTPVRSPTLPGYEQTLSGIYKDEPHAYDMVRARRKLQEFEAIMREYHDSRAAPPLALRRVK